MTPRKWAAIGVLLATLVIGTPMRVVLTRDLLVDGASAALVLAGVVAAAALDREPAK